MTEDVRDPEGSPANQHLFATLSRVMAQIDAIPKTGRNTRFNYDYIESDVLADQLRQIFVAEGLVIIPGVSALTREEIPLNEGTTFNTQIAMTMTLCDVASGEQLTIPWQGEGVDRLDKGLYKAITGGMKYFLLKLFQIGAGGTEAGPGRSSDGSTHTPSLDQQRSFTYRDYWPLVRDRLGLTEEDGQAILRECQNDFDKATRQVLQQYKEQLTD